MSSNTSELYLSEGTCYFGAGQLADSHFIPCGNANLEGPQACCYEYDYCLSSNTCWDPDTVVTYIAGCTDPLYRSDKCPQRYNYPGQQWVALAKCDGDDGDLWTGCALHPEDIQIQKENCDCNKTNVLIQNPNGKESFDEIGRLPNATSEAITYNPTVIPSALPTDDSGGLSTGAKAGIGVGVAIVALLLIAGAAFFFYRRRKNQRQADGGEKAAELGGSTMYGGNEKSELGSDDVRGGKSTGGTTDPMSELSPQREILEMESPDENRERVELDTNASSGMPHSVTSGSTLGPETRSAS
jgi:LPXTG-motif cell wall-anchored protein